ncbi:Histone deacetylase 5 [Raphanus sativus]|uniref:histone deacetylase n=1 Tax=Raphanus sativus TaxID=3726 RepID=A0A9W3CNC8_RAPSA|nr:histone deacetylase 5-like [Raphanus sativus]KAJ4872002.1 Histone deacetylase 5 [Raphanus sativus]
MDTAVESSVNNSGDCNGESNNGKVQRKVGLVYDETMCKHDTPDGEAHPERPDRIRVIWEKLQLSGVTQRCVVLGGTKAEDKHLQLVHTTDHVNLVKSLSTKKKDDQRDRIASLLNSIYINGGSSEAAYLAAGSVVEVTEKVAKGELDSGFAIVRPPGHHAEADKAMGFCFFNNVAVAASYLLNERPDLGVKKILIVDWDVHHGNGTQKMFWRDPRVLVFSVHRHEGGSFYPGGDEGDYSMVGEGPGEGFNINVPWEQGRCGDADYLAAWDHILIPVAKEFNPDIILLSAGFDAAIGDPLGGCRVTPYGYSVMLKKLMEFAQGKIVMALEGGYNLDSTAKSSLACVQVLLEDKPIQGSCEAMPFMSTWRVIQAVRKRLCTYWPSLADELSSNLIDQKTPTPIVITSNSNSEAKDNAHEIMDQMSKLNIENHQVDTKVSTSSWRSDLSKVDVWYASFGSNMWKQRFLCYIEGGQVEGMTKPCVGSMDKSPPKGITWGLYPNRLFFGRESTNVWGQGGVAFLNPLTNLTDQTHMCLYRITLEQFNDVLFQENGLNVDFDSPIFDLTALKLVENNGSTPLEADLAPWYGNVVCMGREGDIPILTMTCTLSLVEKFTSGEIPLRPPAKAYANTFIRGLVEGGIFSEEEAEAYIDNAASKPL